MTRYCPLGDGAFDDWVGSCPDCGSTLVDTPPDPDTLELDPADASPAFLTTAPNEIEANLIAGILRDEGIPVMLRPGGPGFGAWASSFTFEHAIYVRESDIERARSVLEETTIGSDDTFPEES
jgi:hypothetical protein